MSGITLENIRRVQDQPGWISEEVAREARRADIAEGIRSLKASYAAGNRSEWGHFPHSWSEIWNNVMRSAPSSGTLKIGG